MTIYFYRHCPKGEGTWCSYQAAVLAGTVDDYHHSADHIHPKYMEPLRAAFEVLTQTSYLQGLLHDHSTCCNESFHGVLWRFCSKVIFVGS